MGRAINDKSKALRAKSEVSLTAPELRVSGVGRRMSELQEAGVRGREAEKSSLIAGFRPNMTEMPS